jgi:hypothetical protein
MMMVMMKKKMMRRANENSKLNADNAAQNIAHEMLQESQVEQCERVLGQTAQD